MQASLATGNSKQTLYLIDGSGFIFRAYHALPALTNSNGVPIGAVLGFVNMLLKLMEGKDTSHVAVVFDAARHTFRNRIYSEYKAHRPPPPDDLVPQFAIVREATKALNLACVELLDYEADDIIASYSKAALAQDMRVVIVSSDKDLMQLICEGVEMFDAMKQKTIGAAEVTEKFGVDPCKVRHVLSLIGDSSDNVPGVPGIGPKTAAELIGRFETIEGLLSRTAEITQAKRREVIEQNAERARISYELIGLKEDVPLPLPIDQLTTKAWQPEMLFPFLQSYGLKSILTRLQMKAGMASPLVGLSASESAPSVPKDAYAAPQNDIQKTYSIIRDEQTLIQWIDKARAAGHVAFDTETTALCTMTAQLVGFSLCIEPGIAAYVPLQHKSKNADGSAQAAGQAPDLFNLAPPVPSLAPGQIPLMRAIELIKPLLEDRSVLKIGHNIKYDLMIMRHYGMGVEPIEDSMLLSYALHAGEHNQGLDELAERYFKHQMISYESVTGTGRNRVCFDEVDIEKAGEYAAEDADYTLRLAQYFKPQLFTAHLLSVYETIERPLLPVIARMEQAGIKVDRAQLAALSHDFSIRMNELEKEICGHAGCEFNIGSPKQLGEILFDKLQLPGGKKSGKTGAYATGNEVLEELAESGHPLPQKVIEWRQLSKLKSTYSDALAQQIDPRTGRVHTSFAMALTSTGRLSSSDPNLQNIPIRTTEGKKIRNAFVAEAGNMLLSADYSQIELRLLAHMADIPTLKEAFRNGDDIHAITASQMFGVPVSQVDGDLRRKAKTINFGIIYGISAHGLAVRLGIGRSEAAIYINQYFQQYPGIRNYMEESKHFAREHGYVMTLFGRRCNIPGIAAKLPGMRAFSERAAINAPLQGTAADIIKRAMITIDAKLPASSLNARMLLQVHDELVFEVAQADAQAAQAFVKKEMEAAAELSVPLTVETGIGSHWGEAH